MLYCIIPGLSIPVFFFKYSQTDHENNVNSFEYFFHNLYESSRYIYTRIYIIYILGNYSLLLTDK